MSDLEDSLAARATELFKLCDHKAKGYITEEDLVLVTEELGLPLTEEQITLTFSKLDKDQNNYLTLAEFISGFGLFLGASHDESEVEPIQYSQAHQLFDLCDREKKGYIIKLDLQRLAGEFELTEQQLGDLFHSLDQDHNNYLTLEEFVTGFSIFLQFETNNKQEEEEVERIYESDVESAEITEDVIFERIANKVGDDLLSGMLSKGQLRDLWKALSSNEVVGFEKLTEFLTEVSQEIKQSRTQALNVEKTLKTKVEAHEMEIQKLYERMDTQLKNERKDISSHHEKKEKEISEQFENEMELKERELQELLNQQKQLEKKIMNLNKVDMDVRDENDKLLETNFDLQSKLDESSSSLEDTKCYVHHLQSLTLEERKEKTRTAMTIAQGMQKEHESLIKQLDLLREVNQKLRDQKDTIQAAHEASLDRGPHRAVSRQGSEMSKYFETFDFNTRLSSVDEGNGASDTQGKRKLQRTKGTTHSLQSPVDNNVMEFVGDGAEFESDRVFEHSVLRNEKSEWMKQTETSMSQAEQRKAEQEFRDRKTNFEIAPEHQNGSSKMNSNQLDSFDDPLSVRTPPVGIEDVKVESSIPDPNSHLQRVYKVVFVGNSGVGKSSFIHRYCYEIWKPSYTATIGVDFQVKSLELGLKKMALQLWDTAGQERFRSITKQYFRKADGVVLLYDLTSESSFLEIKSWMASVEEAADPGCTVMLVGNKLDLCQEEEKFRVVDYKDAEKVAEDYGILYTEASAKTGENVNEAMETLARVLAEREDWQLHSVLNLKLKDYKKKKLCCSR